MISALGTLTPLLILVAIVAVISSSFLGGFNFTWKAIQPKASKLSPLKGLKRIFSVRSLVELAKALLKFGLVGITAWFLILAAVPEFGEITLMALEPGINEASTLLITSVLSRQQYFDFNSSDRCTLSGLPTQQTNENVLEGG